MDIQTWASGVSRQIQQRREAAGLTLEALAEDAGLPVSQVRRIEAGRHTPSRVTVEKIARALRVDAGELDPDE